jgi:predicted thioesterase
MSGSLQVGMEDTQGFEVAGRLLTDVDGTIPEEVLSTPGMIAMMERTAAMLVRPALPDGKATVGYEVNVRHVRAARRGENCTVRAQLEEIVDGRKLRFVVEVISHDGHTIGVGKHERRVIDVGPGPAG